MKFIFSSRTERFGAVESSKMLVIPENSITFDAVFLYLKIPAYVRGDYGVCSSLFFKLKAIIVITSDMICQLP